MRDIIIAPMNQKSITDLTNWMSDIDRDELMLSDGVTPRQALHQIAETLVEGYECRHDGRLLCCFGVCDTMGHGLTTPWFLGTYALKDYPMELMRIARNKFPSVFGNYPKLYNLVWAENTRSIRFLEWLGFTIHPAIRYGPKNVLFHPFTMERAI